MKIRPVGDELSHADGRKGRHRDMKKLVVAVGNFANTSKIHCD